MVYESLNSSAATDVTSQIAAKLSARLVCGNDGAPKLQCVSSSSTLWITFNKKKALIGKTVSLCTDDTPAMLGARRRFPSQVKQVNRNVQVVHCLLHSENLAAQHLSLCHSAVMLEVVAIVNFIKSSAISSFLSEQMCVNLRSEF